MQTYPCKSNLGELAQHKKVWCAELGKGSVPAQLVNLSVCERCGIRLGTETGTTEQLRAHDRIWSKYVSGQTCRYLRRSEKSTCCGGTTSVPSCTFLSVTSPNCQDCKVSPKLPDFTTIIPLFNLTETRLAATKTASTNINRLRPIYVVAYRETEVRIAEKFVGEHGGYLIKRTPAQEYFLKEELCNFAVRNLQLGKYCMFLDGDCWFSVQDLPERIIHALQSYDLVQPFEMATYLNEHGKSRTQGKSFARQYVHNGAREYGWPGLAWAAKTETWRRLGGFPSVIPTGSGDGVFARMLLGKQKNYPPQLIQQVAKYEHLSVSYAKDVNAIHTFDGVLICDKKYEQRFHVLKNMPLDLFRMADNGLPEFAYQCDSRSEIENLSSKPLERNAQGN